MEKSAEQQMKMTYTVLSFKIVISELISHSFRYVVAYLEILSADHPGHVRIRGLLTNLYIAMNKKGRLYGEVSEITEQFHYL